MILQALMAFFLAIMPLVALQADAVTKNFQDHIFLQKQSLIAKGCDD